MQLQGPTTEQILQIKEFVITTVFHVKSDVAQWLSHTKTEADIITARLAPGRTILDGVE